MGQVAQRAAAGIPTMAPVARLNPPPARTMSQMEEAQLAAPAWDPLPATRLSTHTAPPERPIDFSTLRIQPKLEISTPGDADEREADEVADRVMRMPAPGSGLSGLQRTSGVRIQRACAACEGEEEGKRLQRSAVPGHAVVSNARPQVDAVRGGQPLAATERAFFEPRFGADFSRVRIHTDSTADAAARSIGALAYTRGQDVVFRQGAYQPDTESGRRLMAHELTHVVQQSANESSATRHRIHRTPAGDLISSHSSWGNLDEVALGSDLATRALAGEVTLVTEVVEELGWANRDDVGVEVIRALTAANLDTLAKVPSARALLHRLYDEVTGGSLAPDELAQADRIIAAELRALPPSEWDQQAATAPVIPYGEVGVLAFGASPVRAERRSGGRIWVKFTVNQGYAQLSREEARRTPIEFATTGVELPARQIVVVKQLDEGGRHDPRPALYLLQLANQTDTATAETFATVVVAGLTLGAGSLVGGGGTAVGLLTRLGLSAATAARVLALLDGAALVLAVVTQLIHDNRGWIISQFGETGRRFVAANDVLGSAIAVYGFTRMIVEMPRTLIGFRDAFRRWKEAKAGASSSLDAEQLATANRLEQQTDDFLGKVDEAEAARVAEAPPAAGDAPSPPTREAAAPVREGAHTQEQAPPARGSAPLARGSSETSQVRSLPPQITGTAIGLEDGLWRVAEVRSRLRISRHKNIAIADVNVTGSQPRSVIGVSGQESPAGTVMAPDARLFETISTGRNPRTFDSEVKILEHIAATMPRNARGTISLFTERPVCISCDGVIAQFRQLFPGVQLNIGTGPL